MDLKVQAPSRVMWSPEGPLTYQKRLSTPRQGGQTRAKDASGSEPYALRSHPGSPTVGGDKKGAADVTIEEQEAAELEKIKAEQEASENDMSRGASGPELHIASHSSTPPSPGSGAFIKAQQARVSASAAHASDEVVEEVLSCESRALVEEALRYRESRQAAAGAVMEEAIADLVAQECRDLVREEVNNAATELVAQWAVAQEMIEAVLVEHCHACAQDAIQTEVLRRETIEAAATFMAQEVIETVLVEHCHACAQDAIQAEVLRRETIEAAATFMAQEVIEALVAEECHAHAEKGCQEKWDGVGHAVNQKKEPVHCLKKEFPTDDGEGDSESDEEMEEARKREQMEMMRLIRERQVLFFPQSQAGELVQDRRLERAGV